MNTLKDLVINENRCSIPWLHTEISLQTNTVIACCKYHSPLGKLNNSFKSIWHAEPYQKLRNDIANKIEHSACSACAVPDSVFSYKTYKNQVYKHLLDNIDIGNPSLPKIFHFTLKNTCNLACRMCHPTSSSRFGELIKRSTYLENLYPANIINNQFPFEQLTGSFGNAVGITITGGEPLIDEDCVELIKLIASEAHELQTVVFSTNMTKFNQSLMDELKTLPAIIKFNISIDGPPHVHEYIRYGCEWSTIAENITKIKTQLPQAQFGINTTISALNVGYFDHMLTALDQLEQEANIVLTHIMLSPVLDSHLHCGLLPDHVKDIYRSRLATINNLRIPGSELIVPTTLNLLAEDRHHEYYQFDKFIKEFDRIAKTCLTDVYPELNLQ